MRLRGLYAITDSGLLAGRLLPAVEAALRGGAAVVQYRDKSGDASRREYEARELLVLCRRYGRPLLINDDVVLAAQIGADGVHLGQGDGSLERARRMLGPTAIIGATCHDSLDLAEAAAAAGADYIAFGAFYASGTKPQAGLAHRKTLRAAKARLNLPVVAIGGITADNAAPLLAAGADMTAVIADLWRADNIEMRARRYTDLFAPFPASAP
jgi:thiamine-phosphate pyrophosphorylase